MAQPLTVLIVDDCLEDREVYRRCLELDREYDYTILEEESGEGALEVCRQFQPDGILLDFLLPDLDGLEFLEQLKKQSKAAMPAVIMLTGYGNEAVAVQAMKRGVQDYLVKGQATVELLRSTMHSAIKNARLSQELQRSEERLQENQRLIERIANTTPGILYVYDLVEQQNVHIYGQLNNLLGYTYEEIQAQGTDFLPKFMHPDDLISVYIFFQKFNSAKDGDILENEYRMRHANGEWRWFFSRDTIFTRNADGSPRQIVGTAFDITERKLAEDALRQSEERYRYLYNAVPQIIWISNVKGECEHINQKWQEFTGQTFEEARRFGWMKVVHPDDIPATAQKWTEAVATGEAYEHEMRYRGHDGIYRWHLARGVPIKDEHGAIVRWFGTSTDIDDRKQLEAERDKLLELEQIARAEAETANKTKDEFVAMVSHDLRSPLSAIMGWTKLLRTRQMDTVSMNDALETIERNAKSQAALLEDLLNMSRMIQGKLQLDCKQVNLAAVVAGAMETAYPCAKAKNIYLESVVDKSIPAIRGDWNRLLQVLGNLLSNAVKFTPSEGRVKVQLKRDGADAEIIVSDTGVGISPEFLPHVFERYFQGDRSHRQGGLGLGLAIARHLVELHGGTIQVASPGEGQGSTFTVKLPC